MLGLCSNGHLTGQRHCGTCGADRGKQAMEYTEPRHMSRKARRRESEALRQQGLLNYDQTRRETAIGPSVRGPNKIANVPTHP